MSRIAEEKAKQNDVNIMKVMKDGVRRSAIEISKLMSENGTPMTYPGVDKICRTRLVSKGLLTVNEVRAGKRTSRTYKAVKVYDKDDNPVKAPETPIETKKTEDYVDVPSLDFVPSKPTAEPKEEKPAEIPTEQKQGLTFNEAIVKIYAGEKVSLISTGNIYSLTGLGIKDNKGITHFIFSKMEMEGLWEVIDLRPCPFCGGEGKIINVKCKGVDCTAIQCKNCEAAVRPARTLNDAKARWNRRTQ